MLSARWDHALRTVAANLQLVSKDCARPDGKLCYITTWSYATQDCTDLLGSNTSCKIEHSMHHVVSWGTL